jgi:hypothetical protein
MWNDPAKGADGLTYRERRLKAMHDGRDRTIAARKTSTAPAAPGPGGDARVNDSSPAEGGGSGHTESKPPAPAPKSARRRSPFRRW